MATMDASPSSVSKGQLAFQRSLNNLGQYLPIGHDKHLKQAFYNTLANIFILLTGAAAVGVYYILTPFIRPLSWALLCGTFLYPFKWRLTNMLRSWLTGLQRTETPFAVGMFILPLQISNSFAYQMRIHFWEYKFQVMGFMIAFPIFYFLHGFVSVDTVSQFIFGTLYLLNSFVDLFDSNWVLAISVGYLSFMAILGTNTTSWLSSASAFMWISILLHFANVAGPFRVPLFLLLVAVVAVGIVKELLPIDEEEEDSYTDEVGAGASEEDNRVVFGETNIDQPSTSSAAALETDDKKQAIPSATVSSPSVLEKPQTLKVGRSKSTNASFQVKESSAAIAFRQLRTSPTNNFFYFLLIGHFVVRMWMHVWVLVLLLLLPLMHYVGHMMINQFKQGGIFHDQAESAKQAFSSWVEARKSVLMPKCLRGLGAFLLKSDQQMISILEKGLDQATSAVFILMLLFGTLLFSVLGAVQIQRESVYMVSATQRVLNNTMNSEYSQWMPKADEIKGTMDKLLKNSHQQGRNLIASRVSDFMPKDMSNTEKDNLINQVLEIWDKLYDTVSQSLAEKPRILEQDTNTSANKSKKLDPTNLFDSVGSAMNHVSGMLQMSAAVEFVKENLGMFMSVLESVFTVMRSNMNVIVTVITFIFSAILGGGTAILNFVLSSVIFLTTLGYLLSSSGDVYKPVEIFSSIPGSSGSSFGTAVEQAISGVFKASLKMAAFYGLHTWLMHLIFGVEIVFIPSALAAMFAAVPFLGAYWAAIPAVIELWLGQGRGVSAIALFLAHMLPSYIVDTRIYSEIEGGHPYVTGLAIAGGIMFMGLEGAIIGPIILCCLIVVFKMYGSILTTGPGLPTPHSQ